MWIVALGRANRRPRVPAVSRMVPKLAVRPTATVITGALIIFAVILSNLNNLKKKK